MDGGYIKLHRRVTESWLYDCKPFCKSMAWLDILLSASYEKRKYGVKGRPVILERGQLGTSLGKLADRWGWKKTTVNSFLEVLISDGMIKVVRNAGGTVITVVNWELYQSEQKKSERRMNADGTKSDTYKKDKKERIYGDDGDARASAKTEIVDNDVENEDVTPDELFRRHFGTTPTDSEREGCHRMLALRGKDIMDYAFYQAGAAGKKNFAYVCGILKKLTARGIKDMGGVADYDFRRGK